MFHMDDLGPVDDRVKRTKKKKFRPKNVKRRGNDAARAPRTPRTPRTPCSSATRPVRIATTDGSSSKQARRRPSTADNKHAASKSSLERTTQTLRSDAPVFVPATARPVTAQPPAAAMPKGCLREILTSPKSSQGDPHADVHADTLRLPSFGGFSSLSGVSDGADLFLSLHGSVCGSPYDDYLGDVSLRPVDHRSADRSAGCSLTGALSGSLPSSLHNALHSALQPAAESKGSSASRETKSSSPATASPATAAPSPVLLIPVAQAQQEADALETDVRMNLTPMKTRNFIIGPYKPGSLPMDQRVYDGLCIRLQSIQKKANAQAVLNTHPAIWSVWKKAHDQLVEMWHLLLTLETRTFAQATQYNPFKESDERVAPSKGEQ